MILRFIHSVVLFVFKRCQNAQVLDLLNDFFIGLMISFIAIRPVFMEAWNWFNTFSMEFSVGICEDSKRPLQGYLLFFVFQLVNEEGYGQLRAIKSITAIPS